MPQITVSQPRDPGDLAGMLRRSAAGMVMGLTGGQPGVPSMGNAIMPQIGGPRNPSSGADVASMMAGSLGGTSPVAGGGASNPILPILGSSGYGTYTPTAGTGYTSTPLVPQGTQIGKTGYAPGAQLPDWYTNRQTMMGNLAGWMAQGIPPQVLRLAFMSNDPAGVVNQYRAGQQQSDAMSYQKRLADMQNNAVLSRYQNALSGASGYKGQG